MLFRSALPVALLSFSMPAVVRADLVTDWNQIAIDSTQTANLDPNAAARALAIVHVAVHDALATVDGRYARYLSDATEFEQPIAADAIAIGAAHRALSALFPDQARALSAARNDALDRVTEGEARDHGVALGEAVADAVLAARADDHADDTDTFAAGDDPGQWRPTVALADVPALTPAFATVTPFVIESPEAFRPAAPPPLDSDTYAEDLAEVRFLGAARATITGTRVTRSANQTEIAKFWEFESHVAFNALARVLTNDKELTLSESARLFARLNLAIVDARIALWDAKYAYGTWSPETALTVGDGDDTDGTPGDINWEPYLVTPPYPEYPSAHAGTGAAAQRILASTFGDDVSFGVTSESLPETTRTFLTLSAAAEENGRSRLYGGVNFAFSVEAGAALGRDVGDFVAQNVLRALPQPDAGAGDGGVGDGGAGDGGIGDGGAGDGGKPGDAGPKTPGRPVTPVDDGCSVSPGEDTSGGWAWLLPALGAGLVLRRRRARSRPGRS